MADDKTTLRMVRTFQAPAQAVFDAWTNVEVLRRWFHARHDWETTVAEVDLRIGGAVRIVMRDPHKEVEYGGGGRYTEIDPPRRLAFTWFWDGNDKRQLIELDFDEQMGNTWNYLDMTPLGRQERWEDSPDGYPQTPPYGWWNYHDAYPA